jgi:carboxyl-terminal processing protease
MHSDSSFWKQFIIGSLIFILGVVVGHRYIQPGQIPFLPKPTSTTQVTQVTNLEQPTQLKDVDFQQFWEVWQLLEAEYVDSNQIDRQQMVYGAIQGMTAAVGDPYTVYLPPEQDKRAAEELAGAFYGIGIELGYIDETLAVVAPLKGMPAEKAGVQAGDFILHVRDDRKNLDEDTSGWSLSEAVGNIRGEKGTEVVLTLYRKNNGAEPFEVSVPRDEIVIPSVEVSFIEQNGKQVAHIELSRFGERTKTEWNAVVNQITTHQPKVNSIVLDMRNNPGGFFDGAIMVASEFIDSGIVVSQQGKLSKRDFRTEGQARLVNYPVKVLVNKGSASASEIVAGALRDLKKAPLIGEQTFGKGTVQDRKQLEGGAGLHITVAKWLMPAGESIQKEGLAVDIQAKDDPATVDVDEALQKALE